MRFFQTLAAGAAFVAAASAIAINDYPKEVVAGKSYPVTYDDKSNTPTTFVLRKGSDNNLDTLGTLTSSATGGSFTWTVASNLVNGDDYALEIRQGSNNNYVGHIKLTGGSSASASASSASASASASSASSASASSASSASKASVTSASTLSTAASASASASNSANGTVTSATLSGSRTPSATTGGSSATGSATRSAGAPQSTGAASTLVTSPLALILGAVAAMAFLN